MRKILHCHPVQQYLHCFHTFVLIFLHSFEVCIFSETLHNLQFEYFRYIGRATSENGLMFMKFSPIRSVNKSDKATFKITGFYYRRSFLVINDYFYLITVRYAFIQLVSYIQYCASTIGSKPTCVT